jgi:hypothetical protein
MHSVHSSSMRYRLVSSSLGDGAMVLYRVRKYPVILSSEDSPVALSGEDGPVTLPGDYCPSTLPGKNM